MLKMRAKGGNLNPKTYRQGTDSMPRLC